MTPKITVVTPTFNRSPHIVNRCIGSVRLQTFGDWKQIVCSDGIREERICDTVYAQGDPRCMYAVTSKPYRNSGNGVRQEVLMSWTDTEYVMFLDDDNYIMPTYLEKMVGALEENEEAAFAICKILHFGPVQAFLGRPPVVLGTDKIKLYHVDTQQFVIRTAVMKSLGWLQKGYCADGYTFEELGKNHKHVAVDECLVVHA